MSETPPNGTSMPKKKDPRMRPLLQPGGGVSQHPNQKRFFDSVEYEVKRQQAEQQGQNIPKLKEDIRTAARRQPHAGLPVIQQQPPTQ